MHFDPRVILQGNAEKQALEENPTGGFTASGVSSTEPTKDLGKDPTRMAGPGGAFAFKMMDDPNFRSNIEGWDKLFAQSNPGREFFGQVENETGAG
jgi:hypothetical protein